MRLRVNSAQLRDPKKTVLLEKNMLEKEVLTEQILSCAFKVHSKLGPGLLESAYQACLKYELEKLGFEFNQKFQFL